MWNENNFADGIIKKANHAMRLALFTMEQLMHPGLTLKIDTNKFNYADGGWKKERGISTGFLKMPGE